MALLALVAMALLAQQATCEEGAIFPRAFYHINGMGADNHIYNSMNIATEMKTLVATGYSEVSTSDDWAGTRRNVADSTPYTFDS